LRAIGSDSVEFVNYVEYDRYQISTTELDLAMGFSSLDFFSGIDNIVRIPKSKFRGNLAHFDAISASAGVKFEHLSSQTEIIEFDLLENSQKIEISNIKSFLIFSDYGLIQNPEGSFLIKVQEPDFFAKKIRIKVIGKFSIGYFQQKIKQFCVSGNYMFMLFLDSDGKFKIYQSFIDYEFEIKKWEIPYSGSIDENLDSIFIECNKGVADFIILTIFNQASGLQVWKLDLKLDLSSDRWTSVFQMDTDYRTGLKLCTFNQKLVAQINKAKNALEVFFINGCGPAGTEKSFVYMNFEIKSYFNSKNGYENLRDYRILPLTRLTDEFSADAIDDLSFCTNKSSGIKDTGPTGDTTVVLWSKKSNFIRGFNVQYFLSDFIFFYPKTGSKEPFSLQKIVKIGCQPNNEYFQVIGKSKDGATRLFIYNLSEPFSYSKRLIKMESAFPDYISESQTLFEPDFSNEDSNIFDSLESIESPLDMRTIRTPNFLFNFYTRGNEIILLTKTYLDGVALR
jgi:hypothetical protein